MDVYNVLLRTIHTQRHQQNDIVDSVDKLKMKLFFNYKS